MTTTLHPACGDEIVLTDDELTELAAIPDPANELETHLACELEAGHPGPHLTQGQASGDLEWWLRWEAGRRELVVLEPCPAECEDGTVCTLPLDHPSGHSFELAEEITGRTPAVHVQQLMLEKARLR